MKNKGLTYSEQKNLCESAKSLARKIVPPADSWREAGKHTIVRAQSDLRVSYNLNSLARKTITVSYYDTEEEGDALHIFSHYRELWGDICDIQIMKGLPGGSRIDRTREFEGSN